MTSSNDSYRDANGRFVKGISGNPKGRPAKELTSKEIITAALPEALMRLVDLVHSEDENVALQASLAIIEQTKDTRDTISTVHLELYPIGLSAHDLARAFTYYNIKTRDSSRDPDY